MKATAASSTASHHSGRAHSMLSLGARGADVSRLQRMLCAAGFNCHGVDGILGPKTLAALKRFQAHARIVVDGKAGPQTFGALRAHGSAAGAVSAAVNGSSFTPTQSAAPPKLDDSHAAPGIAGMLDWAKSMIGTKYASVNPFRFGNVPWDGKAHKSENGSSTVYQYPKGTRVFDCSGFVVAAYRQMGVDLLAHGLGTSSAIRDNAKGFLQNVDRANLKPGDLLTYAPHNGVGHVVIYAGNGMTIECSGGRGVCMKPVNWDAVNSMHRVPGANG